MQTFTHIGHWHARGPWKQPTEHGGAEGENGGAEGLSTHGKLQQTCAGQVEVKLGKADPWDFVPFEPTISGP